MSRKLNEETKEDLSSEIKKLKETCKDSYNIIENSPLDIGAANIVEKALNYVDGLSKQIHNSTTPILCDENLILTQFLSESKQRLIQVEDLTAFTRGTIHEVESQINGLKGLMGTVQEALSRPNIQQQDLTPEHIYKAKGTFQTLKKELHGLIQSLFPNASSEIMDVMGQLLEKKLDEESSGYMSITQENYKIIELLMDMKIVSINPYNDLECKIAY